MSPDKALFLYAGADQHASTTTRQSGAHAGLWYDKYYRGPNPQAQRDRDGQGRGPRGRNRAPENKDRGHLDWIKSVTNAPVGHAGRLDEFAGRRERLAQLHGGRVLYACATARFVTGLGRAHPVDNGFAWHPTLGTPYLPGSGVKGVVRAWARRMAKPQELIDALLGKAPRRDASAEVGRVAFLDAVPTLPAQLEADVMTPHYGAYYQRGEAPGDWLSPVPIVFLVAAAGLELQFPVLHTDRCGTPGTSDEELGTVMGWLEGALSDLGAGAKTAVGYGRFIDSKAGDRYPAWVKDLTERREAKRSPLERALAEVQAMPEHEAMTLVRVLSQGGGDRSAEERELLRQALSRTYLDKYSARGGMGNIGDKKRKAYVRWLRGAS